MMLSTRSVRRSRGFGDAAADYAAKAATLVPGSADYALFTGCAANPGAPACAQATADALSTPYLNAVDYAAVTQAIATGSAQPTLTTVQPKVYPRSFSLVNATRGGGNFQVGDAWTLTVSGPPGQPVTISGNQNGQPTGTSQLGSTDGNGNFQTSGVMSSGQTGNWTETYSVGGQIVGTIGFQVLQSPGPTPTQSTTPPDPTNSSTGLAVQAPAPSPVPDAIAAPSSGIPTWAWMAAGGLALFLVFGRQG